MSSIIELYSSLRRELVEGLVDRLGPGPAGSLIFISSLGPLDQRCRQLPGGAALFAAIEELLDFARFLSGPRSSARAAADVVALAEGLVGVLESRALGEMGRRESQVATLKSRLSRERAALGGQLRRQTTGLEPRGERSGTGLRQGLRQGSRRGLRRGPRRSERL